MDPQHRLLLEHAVETLASSRQQAAERTAVTVGIGHGDYGATLSLLPMGNYTASGAASSVAAGRCGLQCRMVATKPKACRREQ